MPPAATHRRPPGLRRIFGQSLLLFSGFTLSQGLSFLRNALIGHWLSKGDFGIAATITLALQLLDTLSDLGADRLIVQSSDGDDPRLVSTAHATLAVRGIVAALLLHVLSGPIASYFRIPQAADAFALAALVPLIKGFMHLDPRRAQRRLDNRAFLAVEVLPQLAAVAVLVPLIRLSGDYMAVVWVALVQAAASLAASHVFAERRYSIILDMAHLRRLVAFGWPIWLSAFPLIAVYQADRILVGRLYGMEVLAGYTAAFMLTMVPGLIAAKVGHALMLPLLAAVRQDGEAFRLRFKLMAEGTTLAAAVYAVFFLVAGGEVLPLAFGAQYRGLDLILALLAVMWAFRMVQAVPGVALMAIGQTRPLLWAGVIRALSLALVALAAWLGGGVEGVAAAGIAGEIASLVYISRAARAADSRLARVAVSRSLYIAPAALAAAILSYAMPDASGAVISIAAATLLSSAMVMLGLAVMPSLRGFVEGWLRGSRAGPARAAAEPEEGSAAVAPMPLEAARPL